MVAMTSWILYVFLRFFGKVVPDGRLIVLLCVLLVFYNGLGHFVDFCAFSSCFQVFNELLV